MTGNFLVDVGGTIIAEDGEDEEEIGGKGSFEAEDEEDKDEYVEEERNGEDAAFEGARMLVEVEDVEVGF